MSVIKYNTGTDNSAFKMLMLIDENGKPWKNES